MDSYMREGGERMKKEDRRSGKQNGDWEQLEKEAAVICQDFGAFCGYVIQNQVKLAPKTGNIGMKDCFALKLLLQWR